MSADFVSSLRSYLVTPPLAKRDNDHKCFSFAAKSPAVVTVGLGIHIVDSTSTGVVESYVRLFRSQLQEQLDRLILTTTM